VFGWDSGKAPGNTLVYDSGKALGNTLGYDSGRAPGNTLRYDSGSSSGLVSGSDPSKNQAQSRLRIRVSV
jgi:hypothetical protein